MTDDITTTEPTEKRGRGRPPKTSKPASSPKKTPTARQVEAFHDKLAIAITAACADLPDQVRPSQDEIDSILLPLERFISRRVNVGAIVENPDAADLLAAFAGFAGYAWRTAIYPVLLGRVVTAPQRRAAGRAARQAQSAPPPPSPEREAVAAAPAAPPPAARRAQERVSGAVPLDPSLSEEEQAEQLRQILLSTDAAVSSNSAKT